MLAELTRYLKKFAETIWDAGTGRAKTKATIDAPVGTGGGVSINHKESEISVPADIQGIYAKETHATTTVLGAGGVYTGAWVDTAPTGGDTPMFKSLIGGTSSDQTSATNGVSIEQSHNQSNICNQTTMTTALAGTGNYAAAWEVRIVARYVRIVYTNGATAQTRFSLRMMAAVM